MLPVISRQLLGNRWHNSTTFDHKMILKLFVCGFLLRVAATIATNPLDIPPVKTQLGAFMVPKGTNKLLLYYEPHRDPRLTYIANKVHEPDTVIKVNRENSVFEYTYKDKRIQNERREEDSEDMLFYVSAIKDGVISERAGYWSVPKLSQRCAHFESNEPRLPNPSWYAVQNSFKRTIRWMSNVSEINPSADINTIHLCSYITSFTVFWCEKSSVQKPVGNPCLGPVHSINVPVFDQSRDYFSRTVELDSKTYEFFVSANTRDSSTGMVQVPQVGAPPNQS